jgi:serine protease
MRNIFSILFLLLTLTSVLAQEKPQVVPGNIIIQVPNKNIEALIADNQFFNGTPTHLKLNRLLSEPMAAYLLEFDHGIHHQLFLKQLWDHPSVSLIQLNHLIYNRATDPNDPQYGQQWWHNNNGAGSATADADIDSELAWDITTGGVTALGDTIVVCVVDDGGDLDHPDLMINNWVNYHEIAGNNMDDDGNGYVDDRLGWDAGNGNGNIDNGSHGVEVAGMIGAVGNNNVGVVGVNWRVKIMNMQYGSIGSGSNPNEANVIEAYTYPLVMRRLYESTNGQKGAFVVATNSSWGIDNANPLNAPIWCAFYDTLGAAGILSAGATANNNVNIDNVGDLPSACSSEYMVSVTATNNEDVRTFSGYGQTTVDLGAPGEDVRTTAAGGGYTTTSGTSFATPATAGAIALVYSAPCESLAAIAHANPALAAQMVRDAIFNGVDPVANLTTECVTGGRLNVKNALDNIINNCSTGGCLAPFSLNVSGITDSQANITWNASASIDSFNLSYGIVGGSAMAALNLTNSQYSLSSLSACDDYWIVAQSICDGEVSEWTDTLVFSTDGCCEAPLQISLIGIGESEATVGWNSVLAATSYIVRWKPVSEAIWTEADNIPFSPFTLSSLLACTEYEVQVASNCSGNQTAFSNSETFITFGCGSCTDETFCASFGDNSQEWIGRVVVGDLDNTSDGGTGGYEDFTSISVDLQRNGTYDVSFTPDYPNTAWTEHFRVWIDLNQNGTFSAAELLYDDTDGGNITVTGTLTIPITALLGSARMRVSMAYGGQFGGDYPQDPCDEGQDGEVEDYCVNILDFPEGITEVNDHYGMTLYPSPASDELTVELDPSVVGNVRLELMDLAGKMVLTANTSLSRINLNVSRLASGIYHIKALDEEGSMIGRGRMVKQ